MADDAGGSAAEGREELAELTVAPNAPLAEVLVGELRANGIPAFFQPGSTFGAGSPLTTPMGPCQVWVRAADLERARELLPAE